METGADFQQAAHAPVDVGGPPSAEVIRARIFRSVLLPAPLRPMIAVTTPRSISHVKSFNAQITSRFFTSRLREAFQRRAGDVTSRATDSRSVAYAAPRAPIR